MIKDTLEKAKGSMDRDQRSSAVQILGKLFSDETVTFFIGREEDDSPLLMVLGGEDVELSVVLPDVIVRQMLQQIKSQYTARQEYLEKQVVIIHHAVKE